MQLIKLRMSVVLPVILMAPSSMVLAEQKSSLMRSGELACNDWCKAWMSLGDKHDVAPPPPAENPPPQSAAEESRVPDVNPPSTRQGRGVAEAKPTTNVTRSAGRSRTVVAKSTARFSPIPALSAPVASAPPQQAVLPPRDEPATVVAKTAVSFPEQRMSSRHRPPLTPGVPMLEADGSQNALAGGGDDAATRYASVNWVGPTGRVSSGISASDAEGITGALTAGTLLAMALLPLTSRPRRRGNPGLDIVLRASRRAEIEAVASTHERSRSGRKFMGLSRVQPGGWLQRSST